MRRDLLDDSSSSSSSDSEDGGADLAASHLQVNESYARKFEYNKKREEKQRLEERLGKDTRKRKRDDEPESASDQSTSESEDEGELDTEAVDAEMLATINAIRSKDPRIYDEKAQFYTAIEAEDGEQPKAKKEKPMNLQDYHRQNLLSGGAGEAEQDQPLTYNQEQDQLKKSIIKEMHAVVQDSSNDEDEDEANFLTAKKKPKRQKKEPLLDVENADKDPDKFLSNFMSSRAWAYPDERNLVPFESDDDEEDKRADDFEQAYNMRFEDPAKSNEKLLSHARDMAAKYSVRRDDANPRQKRRDLDKARKEAAKQDLKEDKARLRKLRIEEVEEKVRRIKRAAGLRSKDIRPEDWSHFVDEDWDDEQWEQEMQKRFGDDYYAEEDIESDGSASNGKRKLKKPKFDDDIDIKDIIPDYTDDDEQPNFTLSDSDNQPAPKAKKINHKQQKEDKKRQAKKERRIIEQLVDGQLQLELDHAIPSKSSSSNSNNDNNSKPTGFRYRATSPKSFGLTPRDILLADDAQLNQYAGLKKLAAFRDPDKKRKDQKNLGKKARLRNWRKEVFGNEMGMEGQDLVPSEATGKREKVSEVDADNEDGGVDIVEGGRKKKRRRKNKQKTGEAKI